MSWNHSRQSRLQPTIPNRPPSISGTSCLPKNGATARLSVAGLLGMATDVANPNQYAYRLRKDGVLFGVWSARDRSYLYPDFQFEQGTLRPQVAELLETLPFQDDKGGWRTAFWLYSLHALMDGDKPADIFVTDAERVIEAARNEFCGETDAG